MFHKNSDDAKWRVISGIKVGVEAGMSVEEMNAGLGLLFVELILRFTVLRKFP